MSTLDLYPDWPIQARTFVDDSLSLAVGIFNTAGRLLYANHGLRAVLDFVEDADRAWLDSLIEPDPATLLAAAVQDNPIYEGRVTFEYPDGYSRSMRGKIWHRADDFLLFAEHDGDEKDRVDRQIMALNDEIARLQSELAQTRDELKLMHEQIQHEIIERERAEQSLYYINSQLEERVTTRTGELEHLTQTLQAEIRERQQKESALKESEQRLSLALQAGQHAMWDWNFATGEVIRSPLWGEMLGYSPGELDMTIAVWESLLHPQDVPAVMDKLDAHLTGETPFFDCEYRLQTKMGGWLWVHDHGLVVERTADGQPHRLLGTHRAITARKRAEQALQKAHDELELRVDRRTAALAQANTHLRQEVAERTRAETALAREAKINAALADLSKSLLQAGSFEDMAIQVLGTARELTRSQFGYVGYIDPQTNYLISPTLTHSIWDQCQVENKNVVFDKWVGLWGWVLENRASLITNHPASDPRSTGTPPGHLPIERFLSAPAMIGDTLVGQIALANAHQDYDEQDLALVEQLAVLFAIAVQRKQSEETLRQQAAEQTALYGIAATVVTSLQPQELGMMALDVALSVLNADAGWITFFPTLTADKSPQIIAQHSIEEGLIPLMLPCVACEYYLHHHEQPDSLLTNSSMENCALVSLFANHSVPNVSFICTPLIAGGEALGMLSLVWGKTERKFEGNPLLLQTIGHQIGIALHNAQLYQAARQVDRLRVLNQLDNVLMDAALNSETLIRATLRQLIAAVHATMGAVIIPATGSMALHLMAAKGGWIEADLSDMLMERWYSLWLHLRDRRQILSFTDNALASIPALYDELTASWGIHGLIVPIGDSIDLRAVMILGGRPDDQPFVDEDRALLMTAASRANQALRNAQLYQAEFSQRQLAEALRDTAATLNSTLNLDDVLDRILDHVGRVVPHDSASVFLVDNQLARVVRCRGFEERDSQNLIAEMRFDVNEFPIFRQMMATGRAVAHPDTLKSRVWVDIPGINWIRSYVGAPIQLEGETIGFLSLDSSTSGLFTDTDAERLQAFAYQAAAAIQNARLFEQLRCSLEERERTQTQLIHSEKTAALGRLTASIAHEINNPIQAVQGCLALSLTELDQLQNEMQDTGHFAKLNRYLGVVDSEIDRISTIVKRMRDFYRPAPDVFQPTDIHAMLKSVLNLVEIQLQFDNITIEQGWDTRMPLIEAKADQLKQVFLNLILNASDAMPQGGTLIITTVADTLLSALDNRTRTVEAVPAISIAFRDTGEGITPNHLEHLFEPFFTTKAHGSGLGLSVSYNIVQAHHGRLDVESQVGHGSTFTILLPVQQPTN